MVGICVVLILVSSIILVVVVSMKVMIVLLWLSVGFLIRLIEFEIVVV